MANCDSRFVVFLSRALSTSSRRCRSASNLSAFVHEMGSETQQARASSLSCFPMFNPTSKQEYEAVIASWVGSLMVLARHIVSQPISNLASFHAEQLQQPALTEGKVGKSGGSKR